MTNSAGAATPSAGAVVELGAYLCSNVTSKLPLVRPVHLLVE